MTQVPVSLDTIQLFAYASLETNLLNQVKDSGNRHTIKKICRVAVKSSVIINSATGGLESLALEVKPDLFNKEVDFPLIRGTLFHIERSYVNREISRTYRGFELKLLPSERIIVPEGKVRVQLEPAEHSIDTSYWLEHKKEIAEKYQMAPNTMDEICIAMQEVSLYPLEHHVGQRRFNIGKGRRIILDQFTGNKLYDLNNFWEVDPNDLILEKGTRTFELGVRFRIGNPNYALVMRDNRGNLVDYSHGKIRRLDRSKIKGIVSNAFSP